MGTDSVKRTLLVAFCLCLVCSILVSMAAIFLKPRQLENSALDIKKNLLLSAGLLKNSKASKSEILEVFKRVKTVVVDLATGEEVKDLSPEKFDQRKAAKDPKQNLAIEAKLDLAGIKIREKYSKVYLVQEDGKTALIILPIRGKGLWSTMYGFLALTPDTKTIKGLGFYEHGETPGLGGEIDNPKWKAKWINKKAFNDNYQAVIRVLKGSVNPNSPTADQEIDGLSGATITARGVEKLVHYWLGAHGFGPFLKKFREKQGV